jgi:hypothetical protein
MPLEPFLKNAELVPQLDLSWWLRRSPKGDLSEALSLSVRRNEAATKKKELAKSRFLPPQNGSTKLPNARVRL